MNKFVAGILAVWLCSGILAIYVNSTEAKKPKPTDFIGKIDCHGRNAIYVQAWLKRQPGHISALTIDNVRVDIIGGQCIAYDYGEKYGPSKQIQPRHGSPKGL